MFDWAEKKIKELEDKVARRREELGIPEIKPSKEDEKTIANSLANKIRGSLGLPLNTVADEMRAEKELPMQMGLGSMGSIGKVGGKIVAPIVEKSIVDTGANIAKKMMPVEGKALSTAERLAIKKPNEVLVVGDKPIKYGNSSTPNMPFSDKGVVLSGPKQDLGKTLTPDISKKSSLDVSEPAAILEKYKKFLK